ncbi:MAG TPA: PaaI family thioesterase [Chloroflexia bacterium]|nr:PaaI family thioesterase [Chloroflexia bacterium]
MTQERTQQEDALQDAWPDATCYGCGPANDKGLRIKSYWSEDGSEVVCVFQPRAEYNAGFPNVMYGGLVASLIDCHSIWTAIAHTYRDEGRPHGSLPAISYVTGSLTVRYLKPTSLDMPVTLRARVTELHPKKSLVECALFSGDTKSAEGSVTAVRFSMDKSLGANPGTVEPHVSRG